MLRIQDVEREGEMRKLIDRIKKPIFLWLAMACMVMFVLSMVTMVCMMVLRKFVSALTVLPFVILFVAGYCYFIYRWA